MNEENVDWARWIFLAIFLVGLALACTSCNGFMGGHNAGVLVIGKQAKVGSVEYGEISYLDGLALVDLSRENSEWEIDVDETNGLKFDKESNSIKGIKKIRRRIGRQVTGNLVDLAAADKELARDYIKEKSEKDEKK